MPLISAIPPCRPGNVKFDMSMEDVLQKTQLSEDDVDTTLGEAYPRIIHSISISSLSDDIQEIFLFRMINWYLWNMP